MYKTCFPSGPYSLGGKLINEGSIAVDIMYKKIDKTKLE